jgi:hypothetical protein
LTRPISGISPWRASNAVRQAVCSAKKSVIPT